MCGIFGFVTTEKSRGAQGRMHFIQQSALVGTLRGFDSAGMFIVPHEPAADAGADWCKVVGTGLDLLQSDHAQNRLTYNKMTTYRAVVGHNRSATVGKVKLDNAHPFVDGPITLVHNGTLDDLDALPTTDHKAPKRVEVDSHLIAHNLAQHPAKEVLESLTGAYALVWHDARTDSIYAARNSQRPLHFMKAKCEDTVLFASEADMLWWVAGRTKFSRDTVYSLDTGILLEWKPGATRPEASKFTVKTSTYKYSGSVSYAGYYKTSTPSSPGKVVPPPAGVQQEQGSGATRRMVERLKTLGLRTGDRLEFSVDSVIPILGSRRGIVNGWVYVTKGTHTEAHQCVLYGVDQEYGRRHKKADWMVRPVGISRLGPQGKEGEGVIARVVGIYSDSYSAPDSGTGGKAAYKGPGGKLVTATEWLTKTTGGCVQCKRSLQLGDHADCMWVEGGTKCMCPACVDDTEKLLRAGLVQ